RRNWSCAITTDSLGREELDCAAAAQLNKTRICGTGLRERCLTRSRNKSPMSKIIVIIGAPGAGKGTQARLLSEKFGFPQISTGDILRAMSKADTPQARQLRQVMASGKLVSDDILADLIFARTSEDDCREGYILDGFPRTLNQARILDRLAE